MYGESSFTWEYVCGYETREQRKGVCSGEYMDLALRCA